jgi:hypothetical protein
MGRARLVEVVEVEDEITLGEAKAPKFNRCASPESCTRGPALGVPARSFAITVAAPRKTASGETSIRP